MLHSMFVMETSLKIVFKLKTCSIVVYHSCNNFHDIIIWLEQGFPNCVLWNTCVPLASLKCYMSFLKVQPFCCQIHKMQRPTDCKICILQRVIYVNVWQIGNLHLSEDRLFYVTISFFFTPFIDGRLETLNVKKIKKFSN